MENAKTQLHIHHCFLCFSAYNGISVLLLIAIFDFSWRCLTFSLILSKIYLISHMFVGFLLIDDFVYIECQRQLDIELVLLSLVANIVQFIFKGAPETETKGRK